MKLSEFLSTRPDSFNQSSEALLVIAHPDDETMFFLPTLLFVKQHVKNIRVLCLSNGGFDGFGAIREKELSNALAHIDIPSKFIQVLDHKDLQDGMKIKWPKEIVGSVVQMYLEEYNSIDLVITFDSYGVSGHPNHIDTFRGLEYLCGKKEKGIPVFSLQSTSFTRKYMGVGDLLISYFISSINTEIECFYNLNWLLSYKMMVAHYSQFVWYRKLFIIFSRYAYVNTIKYIGLIPEKK